MGSLENSKESDKPGESEEKDLKTTNGVVPDSDLVDNGSGTGFRYDPNLGSEVSETQKREDDDTGAFVLGVDLNYPVGEGTQLGFGSSSILDAIVDIEISDEDKKADALLFGVDLSKWKSERDNAGSSRPRKRYTDEEKGKAKIDGVDVVVLDDSDTAGDDHVDVVVLDDSDAGGDDRDDDNASVRDLNLGLGLGANYYDMNEDEFEAFRTLLLLKHQQPREPSPPPSPRPVYPPRVPYYIQNVEYRQQEQLRAARAFAKEMARRKGIARDADDAPEFREVFEGLFSEEVERIKKKKPTRKGRSEPEWIPSKKCKVLKRLVAPSLLDLCFDVLAKNANAIVSLDLVPDSFRRRLSNMLCDSRRMDARFIELLTRGCPREIRVPNCLQLTIEDFIRIFGACDTKELTVLQLDLGGQCISEPVLCSKSPQILHRLPVLLTISLRGAICLSDHALTELCSRAPALRSIDLSCCSLLTSAGIISVARTFKSTLTELYMDSCEFVNAMQILPALKKLKCLKVLSVARVEAVCDDFVIGVAKSCGKTLKELHLANCGDLTDVSIKFVGEKCPGLYVIDLSLLENLTNLSLQYLANGCRSICKLILCSNNFSDEAVAAFLEISGHSLVELSLNRVRKVGPHTAKSLSKTAKKLVSLDLSWCRNLNDEAVGLIVDSCFSLKRLKLFGCSQITEMFWDGHSNPQLQIIGLSMTPISKHLEIIQPQEAPLRYPIDA